MSQSTPNEITGLLVAWGEGDESALERLIPVVYDELRRLAHRYMRGERPGPTLQATACKRSLPAARRLERRSVGGSGALLRCFSADDAPILIDFARDRQYLKRGGGALRVSLGEAMAFIECPSAELVALDEALTAPSEMDRRKGQVVEMRFFGGLSV